MTKTRALILLPLTLLVLSGVVWNDSEAIVHQATGPIKEEEPRAKQSLHAEETSQTTTTLLALGPLTGLRSFTGRVLKVGNRYVLKDAVVGATYVIDPQQAVSDFEGMMVRLNGTLDPSGNIIRLEAPQRYW